MLRGQSGWSRLTLGVAAAAFLAGLPLAAQAKVSQAEVDRLGKDLTPLGGEVAGNKDGSIPAYDGGLKAPPAGYTPGMSHINPFKDDKVLFSINAGNMAQYADKLTEGQKQVLKAYSTYRMDVYQSRRSCNITEKMANATKVNGLNSELINDGNGISGAILSVPFPITDADPKVAGVQNYWNHRLTPRNFKFRRAQANASVQRNGDYFVIRSQDEGILHWSGPGLRAIGDVTQMEQLNNIWVTYLNVTTEPARLAGSVLLVYETIDQMNGARQAWQYNPGTRRVLRAPQVAYDNPIFNGDGLGSTDQFDMMNGAPDRYSWESMGKSEKYIAYNSYEFQSSAHKYADLVKPGHVNPDVLRYELHRVRVTEAKLREGFRHIYSRRTFYQDEDTWRFAYIDLYDTRGDFWRAQEGPIVNWYEIPFCYNAAEMYYDLQSGRYLTVSMRNEEPQINWNAEDIQPERYTPDAIRRLGVR
jgi:hypothetical protein